MALSATHQAEIEDFIYKTLAGLKIKLGREDIIPPIEEELHRLIAKAIEPVPEPTRKVLRSSLKAEPSESSAMKFLKKYASPGNAKKPILFIGSQGSGKTTAVKQFAYN